MTNPNPKPDEKTTVTSSKTTTVKDDKADKADKPAKHGALAPAGASGDPAVQHALANLQTAQMNRNALDVEAADIKAADDAVKVAQDALAELGYC
jgi:hypothetical protein